MIDITVKSEPQTTRCSLCGPPVIISPEIVNAAKKYHERLDKEAKRRQKARKVNLAYGQKKKN
jgi:hypothetical protein